MAQELFAQILENPRKAAKNYLIAPPKFLFNHPDLCCLLGESPLWSYQNCLGTNQGPLGKVGKVATPYLVTIGNTNYILKTSTVAEISLVFREKPPTDLKEFKKSLDRAPSDCLFPSIDTLKYLGADEFTNEMLIGITLNNYFSQLLSTFQPSIHYYQSTLCQDNPGPISHQPAIGLHLIELADLGTLDEIPTNPEMAVFRESREVIEPRNGQVFVAELIKPIYLELIIKQVVVTLYYLQEDLAFNHGDLKITNILVSSEPASGILSGVDISGPFTCKIADYGKSSLTLPTEEGSVRLYHRNWLADQYLTLQPFTPLINTDLYEEDFYVIQNWLNAQLYTRTRHMGLPFYLSFDTYTFLVSLLSQENFYYAFFSSPELVEKIWEPLWFYQDGQVVQNKIFKVLSNPAKANRLSTVLEILRGVRLKCQATKILVDNLVT